MDLLYAYLKPQKPQKHVAFPMFYVHVTFHASRNLLKVQYYRGRWRRYQIDPQYYVSWKRYFDALPITEPSCVDRITYRRTGRVLVSQDIMANLFGLVFEDTPLHLEGDIECEIEPNHNRMQVTLSFRLSRLGRQLPSALPHLPMFSSQVDRETAWSGLVFFRPRWILPAHASVATPPAKLRSPAPNTRSQPRDESSTTIPGAEASSSSAL